jgi:hypothetical protein
VPEAKGKLKTGFGSEARRGFAKQAGEKGRQSLTRKLAERRAANELAGVKAPVWSGGFKKDDPRTKAVAKYAILERWRRYYEQKAQELEKQRGKYNPEEISAVLKKVEEAREFRALEGKDLAFKKYEEQRKYISGMESRLKTIQKDLEALGVKSAADLKLPAPKPPEASAPPAPTARTSRRAAAAPAAAAPAPAAAAPVAAAPAAASTAPAAAATSFTPAELARARRGFQAENLRRMGEGLEPYASVEEYLKDKSKSGAETSVAAPWSRDWMRKGTLGLSAMAFGYLSGRLPGAAVGPLPADIFTAICLESVHMAADTAVPGLFPRKLLSAVDGVSSGALANFLLRVGTAFGRTGKLSIV